MLEKELKKVCAAAGKFVMGSTGMGFSFFVCVKEKTHNFAMDFETPEKKAEGINLVQAFVDTNPVDQVLFAGIIHYCDCPDDEADQHSPEFLFHKYGTQEAILVSGCNARGEVQQLHANIYRTDDVFDRMDEPKVDDWVMFPEMNSFFKEHAPVQEKHIEQIHEIAGLEVATGRH